MMLVQFWGRARRCLGSSHGPSTFCTSFPCGLRALAVSQYRAPLAALGALRRHSQCLPGSSSGLVPTGQPWCLLSPALGARAVARGAQHPPRAQRPCTVLPLGVTCYKKVRAEMCPGRAQTGELQHRGCSQDRGVRGWQKRGVVQGLHGGVASACLGSLLTQKHEINKTGAATVRKTGAGPGTTSASPVLGWRPWHGGHWGHLPHATGVCSGVTARGRQRS